MRTTLAPAVIAFAAFSAASSPVHAEELTKVEQKIFVQSCSSNKEAMKPYCECTLAELQKRMTAEEIRGMGSSEAEPMKNEKFAESVIACAHLIANESSEEGETLTKLEEKVFVKSCSSDKDEMKPYCECTLAELQKRMTLEEIRNLGAMSEKDLMNNDKFSDSVVACADKLP